MNPPRCLEPGRSRYRLRRTQCSATASYPIRGHRLLLCAQLSAAPKERVLLMVSQLRRDPISDPLLTPENATLILIDYQPTQIETINSIDTSRLVRNAVSLAQTAVAFGLPRILSTVAVQSGTNADTSAEIKDALGDATWIDRSSINAWEDADFVAAVEATGRRKLIMGGLWTEVCLAFPATDALRAGYEVFVPVDAVGGTSVEAHQAGLSRCQQAGAQLVSWVSVLAELQRDWSRSETLEAVKSIDAANRA